MKERAERHVEQEAGNGWSRVGTREGENSSASLSVSLTRWKEKCLKRKSEILEMTGKQ